MSTSPVDRGEAPSDPVATQSQEDARKFHAALYRATDALSRAGDAAQVYDWANVNRVYVRDQLMRAIKSLFEACTMVGLVYGELSYTAIPPPVAGTIPLDDVIDALEKHEAAKGGEA